MLQPPFLNFNHANLGYLHHYSSVGEVADFLDSSHYYKRIERLIVPRHSIIVGNMSRFILTASAAILGIMVSPVWSASTGCSASVTPTNGVKPSVASGYQVALVATGLTNPRSIQFDSLGNLLVVQDGAGIANLVFQDDGGTCLSVKSTRDVIKYDDVSTLLAIEELPCSHRSQLNHGLALSRDGKTIYASSSEAVYSWAYDPEDASTSGTKKTLITGMNNQDHTTRTLLLSQKIDGLLLVSRGSTSNIDAKAEVLSSGHSQIKAFNLNNITDDGYDFTADGLRLGWGLRNSVGVAEHPDTGGIYSVENSVDQMTRDGKDVHQDNPGEEMNFHGYLNGTKYAGQGSNYGYPNCFAAWMPNDLPQNANLTVGSQFAIGDQNDTINDTYCSEQTPPRLTFQAHMAPLDIYFNNSGSEAWVTFHGSWYVQLKLFMVYMKLSLPTDIFVFRLLWRILSFH